MDPAFEVHKLNESGLAKAGRIAQGFDALLTNLRNEVGGESREMSLVKTHLETACFFAKKACAMQPENWQ